MALAFFILLDYARPVNSLIKFNLLPQSTSSLFELTLNTLVLFAIVFYTQVAFSLLTPTLSNEFYFYEAKGFFEKISKTARMDQNMNWLRQGLNSYNKYLKREISLQIYDIGKVCYKFITIFDSYEQINTLRASFSEGNGKDTLHPLKAISKLFDDKESHELLIQISVGQKIREYSDYIIPIVSVLATIIGLLLRL